MDARSLGLGLFVATTAAQLVALSAMVQSKAYRKYPALAGYLAVCLVYCTTFGLLPYAQHFISADKRNLWFFWGYWGYVPDFDGPPVPHHPDNLPRSNGTVARP